jgi:hypothetical protein
LFNDAGVGGEGGYFVVVHHHVGGSRVPFVAISASTKDAPTTKGEDTAGEGQQGRLKECESGRGKTGKRERERGGGEEEGMSQNTKVIY